MINSAGDGFLIDWDLSRLISELGTGPIEPERTVRLVCRFRRARYSNSVVQGTWQFQSALFLRWPRKPYRSSDDIESFIHAFRYMVLRYHVTTVVNLYTFVETYFDNYASVNAVFDDGVRVVKRGGDEKLLHFRTATSGFGVAGSPKLQVLLDNIARRCYESYAAIDNGRMDRIYGLPERTSDNQQEQQDPAPQPVQSLNLSCRARDRPNRRPPVISQSATPASPADPCDISGFLADSQEVIDVFMDYIDSTSSPADQVADAQSKAADEFKRRDSEWPKFNPLSRLPNRHISALSTSYTPESANSASVFVLAAPDNHGRSSSAGAPSGSSAPSRDPSAAPSRATSLGPSVAPSSNEPSRQGSPLPGAPPIAGPSPEGIGEMPLETLGKRRGRTSDVVEAVSRIVSGTPGTSKALPKPPKKARN